MKNSTALSIIKLVCKNLDINIHNDVILSIFKATEYLDNVQELENTIERLMFFNKHLYLVLSKSVQVTLYEAKTILALCILLYPLREKVPVFQVSDSTWEAYFSYVDEKCRKEIVKLLTFLDDDEKSNDSGLAKILKVILIGETDFDDVLETILQKETHNFMSAGFSMRNKHQIEDAIVLSTYEQLTQQYGENGSVWLELQSLMPKEVLVAKKYEFMSKLNSYGPDILKHILGLLDTKIQISYR